MRDPTPLWRTNVEGLRRVLDVAVDATLKRFVFTSSIATIGRRENCMADEKVPNNWLDTAGDYVRTRVEAENLVVSYCRDRGLLGVAACVANTYGPEDWLPTPHGGMVAAAVHGKLPFYVDGWDGEVVSVEDAAHAMILAAEHGRIGERYVISERFMSSREIYEIACDAVGVAPPRWRLPIRLLAAASYPNAWIARLLRRDTQLTPINIRLMSIMTPLDHSKAVRELGWQPASIPDAIARAARFFQANRRNAGAR